MRSILMPLLAVSALAATLAERDAAFIGKRRSYWTFQKPVRAALPAGQANPVDALLASRAPSALISGEKLIRRVTLDLTGLPPAPAQVDAFLKDKSPNAYEKLVDRLMASKHYGERWGLRWLDIVRYADTNGFELDAERTHAWRYRDYVINAFNSNKPYDRFVQEQLAGDEIWPGSSEALIATGFLRAGPEHIVGGNQDEEMNRQEVLTEMTTITGSALLGMTIQCARCHNHKFDPIPQSDHYRLQAVFANTFGEEVAYASAAAQQAYKDALKAHEAKLGPLQKAVKEIDEPYRLNLVEGRKKSIDPALLAAFDIPKDKRAPDQERLAKEAEEQMTPAWDEVVEALPADLRAKRYAIRKQMHAVELQAPAPFEAAYAVINAKKPAETHILKVGDHKSKLDAVPAGLPQVIADAATPFPQGLAGRRAALAQWLTSKDNPVTARVMVNRIWQFRFGSGIVSTPNDFGTLGARPSNQKLLDWLAAEFMDKGWDIRAIDRLLVLSEAYRQQSNGKRRLEGEAIRDSILAVSGALNSRMGGPGVRTPIEPEIYDLIFTEGEKDNLWPLPADPAEINRRSIYLLNKRSVRLPMLATFDQPDTMSSCAMRQVSTHALQSLTLMNSDFMQEQSKVFARRIFKECDGRQPCMIDRSYRLTLGRLPSAEEKSMAAGFLQGDNQLSDYCLALLNRNEFVYVP